jgi:hypothetical protein
MEIAIPETEGVKLSPLAIDSLYQSVAQTVSVFAVGQAFPSPSSNTTRRDAKLSQL